MEKFEQIMMKISKVFGLILMSFTLLLIAVSLVVFLLGVGGKFFERTVPSVSFDKADFSESPKVIAAGIEGMTGHERMKFFAERGARNLAPMYESRLDAYMEREKENLFKNEETRAEDMTKYKKTRTDAFVENTWRLFYGYISNLSRKYEEPYVEGAVSYIKAAENSGFEALTNNKVPVNSLYNSRVLKKYNEIFAQQMREIEGRSSGGSFFMSMAGYGTAMGLIFTFLMLSVMFAIIRIEKKMKG